jgi:hypothetical protein
MMGDFGNAIKYLYTQFILRDVLSFITPGAIVVWAVLYLFFPCLLSYSYSIHWLLYIPLFGLFYIVGFAIQCLGEFFGIIFLCPPSKFGWRYFSEPLKILRCKNWDNERFWWRDYYEWMKDFWEPTHRDEDARQGRERLVVLKQMCGNGFLAIVISGVLFGVSYCPFLWGRIVLAIALVALPLLASLFWGHRVHVLRQYDREYIIISEYRAKRQQSKKGGV